MPLSDTKARNAKPRSKPYKIADGDGLFLLVKPSGSKYWRMRYFFAGKEKLLALGVYPEVPLGDARELALQCAHSEHYDSELRRKCENLHTAVDALATELTGDPAYFHLKVAPSNNAG